MLSDFEREQRLNLLLVELSNLSTNPDLKKDDFYERLEKIYIKEESYYRHMYSSLYKTISAIKNNYYENCNIDTLADNITNLREKYKPSNSCNIESYLSKLCDHVNLEVNRFNALIGEIRKGDNEAIDLTKKFTDAYEEKLKEFDTSAKNMQTQYVSILGIFASIIIGFVGFFSFTKDFFSSLSSISTYKVFGAALICGFFFCLIEWMLIYLLLIVNKVEDSIVDKIKEIPSLLFEGFLVLSFISMLFFTLYWISLF